MEVLEIMMSWVKRATLMSGAAVLAGGMAMAQSKQPASAIPGTINYTEGRVSIDGQAVPRGQDTSVVETGQVLRTERSYIWARPGEQRGCAGCHSSKAVAPENRWPLTLKRFDTPTALAIQDSNQERASASTKAPVN